MVKNWNVINPGLITKQVDYANTFSQAKIKEEVYVEPPKRFEDRDTLNNILYLLKSLYHLK